MKNKLLPCADPKKQQKLLKDCKSSYEKAVMMNIIALAQKAGNDYFSFYVDDDGFHWYILSNNVKQEYLDTFYTECWEYEYNKRKERHVIKSDVSPEERQSFLEKFAYLKGIEPLPAIHSIEVEAQVEIERARAIINKVEVDTQKPIEEVKVEPIKDVQLAKENINQYLDICFKTYNNMSNEEKSILKQSCFYIKVKKQWMVKKYHVGDQLKARLQKLLDKYGIKCDILKESL